MWIPLLLLYASPFTYIHITFSRNCALYMPSTSLNVIPLDLSLHSFRVRSEFKGDGCSLTSFQYLRFFSPSFFPMQRMGVVASWSTVFSNFFFFTFTFLQSFFALLFRKSSPLFWSTALCHVPSTIDSLSPAQYVSRSLGCFLSLESYLIHNPAAPLCVSCAPCDWVWFYCHLRQVKAKTSEIEASHSFWKCTT